MVQRDAEPQSSVESSPDSVSGLPLKDIRNYEINYDVCLGVCKQPGMVVLVKGEGDSGSEYEHLLLRAEGFRFSPRQSKDTQIRGDVNPDPVQSRCQPE